jgi:hypothetical protein
LSFDERRAQIKDTLLSRSKRIKILKWNDEDDAAVVGTVDAVCSCQFSL